MGINQDLKWAREHAGMTQTEAAELLRVTRVTYNRWEVSGSGFDRVKLNKFIKLAEIDREDMPKEGDTPPEADAPARLVQLKEYMIADTQDLEGLPPDRLTTMAAGNREKWLAHSTTPFRPSNCKALYQGYLDGLVVLAGRPVKARDPNYSVEQDLCWKNEECKAQALKIETAYVDAKVVEWSERIEEARITGELRYAQAKRINEIFDAAWAAKLEEEALV